MAGTRYSPLSEKTEKPQIRMDLKLFSARIALTGGSVSVPAAAGAAGPVCQTMQGLYCA
jgi:hypothetical protein